MTIKYVQTLEKYQAGSGNVIGATTVVLTDLTDIYGNVLTMTDFGSKGFITLEPRTTNEEAATFTGITANANGTYSLTGVKTVIAKSPYTETSGLVNQHAGGTTVIITDNVAFWNTFGNKENNETITGLWNVPTGGTGTQIANATDISNAITGISGTATDSVFGTVKLSVSAASVLNPIVVGDNDTRVPTQGENDALVGTLGTPSSTNKFVTENDTTNGATMTATTIAFTASNHTISDSGAGFVTAGFRTGDSIIITGSASNNGTFTLTSVLAGTMVVSESLVDESLGATVIISTAIIGKLIRINPATGLIPSTVISQSIVGNMVSLTAGEDILKNDMVYPTANDTVKRYRPTGVTSSTAVTKGVKSAGNTSKNFLTSTTNMICADVCNGADYREVTIDPLTGNGTSETTNTFTADTSKYGDACYSPSGWALLLWQNVNVGASGIKARIGYSGSIQTIETTGNQYSQLACTMIDSTHALIAYQKDSDAKLYVQVLTISGTTISTNTPVVVTRTTNTAVTRVQMQLIDTNKVLIAYQDTYTTSAQTIKTAVISISGTTPTVGTPVLVATNTSNNNGLYDLSLQYVTTGKAVLIYEIYGGGSGQPDINFTSVVISVSGTTPSAGTPVVIDAHYINFYQSILQGVTFSQTLIGIPYCANGTTSSFAILEIIGSTISIVSNSTLTSGGSFGGTPTGASSCKTGVFKVQVGGNGSPRSSYVTLTQPSTSQVGIATADTLYNASVPVLLRQRISTTQTGLTGGLNYNINNDGQPTTESSNSAIQYGTAINATNLFIK